MATHTEEERLAEEEHRRIEEEVEAEVKRIEESEPVRKPASASKRPSVADKPVAEKEATEADDDEDDRSSFHTDDDTGDEYDDEDEDDEEGDHPEQPDAQTEGSGTEGRRCILIFNAGGEKTYVEALFDYLQPAENTMKFAKGDRFQVLEQTDKGWYYVKRWFKDTAHPEELGYIPQSYTQKVSSETVESDGQAKADVVGGPRGEPAPTDAT